MIAMPGCGRRPSKGCNPILPRMCACAMPSWKLCSTTAIPIFGARPSTCSSRSTPTPASARCCIRSPTRIGVRKSAWCPGRFLAGCRRFSNRGLEGARPGPCGQTGRNRGFEPRRKMAIAPSKPQESAGQAIGIMGETAMKSNLRPYITAVFAILLGASLGARAQSTGFAQFLEKIDPLLSHSAQGYLGVMVTDLDNDSASKLKLKEVRGALITLIDHDAPAGQVGLHISDVVLELNGQKIESAEQFG